MGINQHHKHMMISKLIMMEEHSIIEGDTLIKIIKIKEMIHILIIHIQIHTCHPIGTEIIKEILNIIIKTETQIHRDSNIINYLNSNSDFLMKFLSNLIRI